MARNMKPRLSGRSPLRRFVASKSLSEKHHAKTPSRKDFA